jgi:hypothetical protein
MNEDSIKATPQSPMLGLLAGGLGGLDSALGSGAISNSLGVGPMARTLENMSYGSPPYRGTGMATKLTPEAVSAMGGVVNMGGFAPIGTANRIATGLFAAPMIENQSLDSVIQGLLNALGRQTNGK